MKKLIKTLAGNKLKLFLSFLALFLLFVVINCTDSLNSLSSNDPVNLVILSVKGDPNTLFGNGCDQNEVEVNTEDIVNGSTVQFEITGSSLPTPLRGCLLNGDIIIENGQAFVNYLAGIVTASSDELTSGTPPTETLNIAAKITINTPNGVLEDSDFVTITLDAVGIIKPDDTDITVPFEPDALSVFVALIFQTIGIKPGTVVTFFLGRPDLGQLIIADPTVKGSVENGSFEVQYNAFNGVGGLQTICAAIEINYPPQFVPPCPVTSNVQVQECVQITQSVEQPMPSATPTGTPMAMEAPSGGGDNGFTIAGGMVRFGQALASVLLPLIPVLVIVFRVRQRREKKS